MVSSIKMGGKEKGLFSPAGRRRRAGSTVGEALTDKGPGVNATDGRAVLRRAILRRRLLTIEGLLLV